jgi:hypothetical protein
MKFQRKVCANLWMAVEKKPRDCGCKVQKERKDSCTQDAESMKNTEKIEAKKTKVEREKSARRGRTG